MLKFSGSGDCNIWSRRLTGSCDLAYLCNTLGWEFQSWMDEATLALFVRGLFSPLSYPSVVTKNANSRSSYSTSCPLLHSDNTLVTKKLVDVRLQYLHVQPHTFVNVAKNYTH